MPCFVEAADQLPLQVNAERDYPEDTRLRFRFLDLRREASSTTSCCVRV